MPGSPTYPHSSTDEAHAAVVGEEKSHAQEQREKKHRAKARITVQHIDVIKDEFWTRRPWLLSNRPGRIPKEP